jgi:hypothetical protein
VYGELLHVWRVGEPTVAEALKAWHESLGDEAVEGLARLPEVDDAPSALDRAGLVNRTARSWPLSSLAARRSILGDLVQVRVAGSWLGRIWIAVRAAEHVAVRLPDRL